MFTGLVLDRGRVTGLSPSPDGLRMTVSTTLAAQISLGDSVAVCGVCLTAAAVGPESFSADIMHETLRRSSLGKLSEGSPVNLELSLRASDRLGGHIVSGHVDGLGAIESIHQDGFATTLTIAAPTELLRYIVEKGSIAVDGVSLTVASVSDDHFSVAIIPETQAKTTLGVVVVGTTVNLEVDVLAKYVEKLVSVS